MMMDPAIIGVTASLIGSLAALVNAWRASRRRGKEPSSEEIDQVLQEAPTGVDRAAAAVMRRVISPDILEVMRENIERARKRLIDALKDQANTPQDKDKEVAVAQSAICSELRRIRKLNQGHLPKDLQSLWDQFGC